LNARDALALVYQLKEAIAGTRESGP
jgi:hypothetical protein